MNITAKEIFLFLGFAVGITVSNATILSQGFLQSVGLPTCMKFHRKITAFIAISRAWNEAVLRIRQSSGRALFMTALI